MGLFNNNYFSGSRITTIFNFGYVSLNILHLRAEDAGSYTVRAVNRLGEALSSATLRVYGKCLRRIGVSNDFNSYKSIMFDYREQHAQA